MQQLNVYSAEMEVIQQKKGNKEEITLLDLGLEMDLGLKLDLGLKMYIKLSLLLARYVYSST